MLERSSLLARIPGLVHGFTTRHGGVSVGRYATLNMGGKWGDDSAAIAENRRRVAEAGGFSLANLRMVRQVHGRDVLHAAILSPQATADGLWTRVEDNHVVAVLTADCVPVLLADRHGRMAAAVHSGWRGTVAGVVPAAVAALVDAGADAGAIVAAIGPCIGVDAFEVGDEVAQQFASAFVDRSRPRPHVNLRGCIERQLLELGVSPASIEHVGGCTFSEPERYFSYRRDGAGIGQMMAFAGFA